MYSWLYPTEVNELNLKGAAVRNIWCVHLFSPFYSGLARHHQFQFGRHTSARHIDIDRHCIDYWFGIGTTEKSVGTFIVGHVAQCHRAQLVYANAICSHHTIGVHNRWELAHLLVDASEQCRLHTIHHYRNAICDNFFIIIFNLVTENDIFKE